MAALFATVCSIGSAASGRSKEVASGASPAGVPWTIKAKKDGNSASFTFDFKAPGYPGSGYGIGVGLPISKRFTIVANAGSEFSPADEANISGVAARDVKTIEVTMDDNSTITVRPAIADASARDKLPFVRDLRFFDRFFSGALAPESLKALDKHGKVLDRQSTHDGVFY